MLPTHIATGCERLSIAEVVVRTMSEI